jgi:hypothetical protein
MKEPTSRGWWSRKIWLLVVFPALGAVLLAVVGVFKGWLHKLVGFDESGRPVIEARDKDTGMKGTASARPRTPVSLAAAYDRLAADISRRDREDRPRIRYLTLLHRHNEPACTVAELESWRQAVGELMPLLATEQSTNSGWIDPDHLLFRLNLDELGWGPVSDWRKLVALYPYGLAAPEGDSLARRQAEVEGGAEDRIPVVRADWFIVALSRPPLAGPKGLLRRPAADLPETIRALVRGYSVETLDLAACARELGLEDGKKLADLIGREQTLQQEFGLAPLTQGERIRREWWESDRHLYSPYQEAARLLKIGKPVRVK